MSICLRSEVWSWVDGGVHANRRKNAALVSPVAMVDSKDCALLVVTGNREVFIKAGNDVHVIVR